MCHHSISSEALRKVFDPTTSGTETARELNNIRQDMDSFSDYVIRFRTRNATVLYDAFISGLSDPILDMLVLNLPEDLDAVIALAVRTDHCLKARRLDNLHATVPCDPARGCPDCRDFPCP